MIIGIIKKIIIGIIKKKIVLKKLNKMGMLRSVSVDYI